MLKGKTRQAQQLPSRVPVTGAAAVDGAAIFLGGKPNERFVRRTTSIKYR